MATSTSAAAACWFERCSRTASSTSCIYPLTRGPGPRLFPDDAAPLNLSLAASEFYENGVVYLSYRAT